GKVQSNTSALYVRHAQGIERLAGAKSYARLRLADCGLLLHDLCLSLLKTNASVAGVQPYKHSAALSQAAQINAHGHDFAADRRRNVRLLVSGQTARGFKEARKLAQDCRCGRDLNDRWRSSGGLSVPVLRGFRPVACGGE